MSVMYLLKIVTMLCLLAEIVLEDPELKVDDIPYFSLQLVKVCSAVALHLTVSPEITKGMNLMHFSNNNPELFINSVAPFMTGVMQCTGNMFAEVLNLYYL